MDIILPLVLLGIGFTLIFNMARFVINETKQLGKDLDDARIKGAKGYDHRSNRI